MKSADIKKLLTNKFSSSLASMWRGIVVAPNVAAATDNEDVVSGEAAL